MGKKQKTYSTEVKARVALEALRGQKTVAQIASEHQGKRSTNHTPSAGGEKKGGVSQAGVVGCSMAC